MNDDTLRWLADRDEVIQKIIRLILDEMKEPEKGNLTSLFAIELLEDTIRRIKEVSSMRPLRHSLRKDES